MADPATDRGAAGVRMSQMTIAQANRVITTLAAYFPGRIPPPSVRLWATAIRVFSEQDAIEGARRLASSSPHPSLSDLIACISRTQTERAELERSQRPTLPAVTPRDEASQKRSHVAATVAVDIVCGLVREATFDAEVQARLRMTTEEISMRRTILGRCAR